MAKKKRFKIDESDAYILIVVLLTIMYYAFLPIVFGAIQGEANAGLSLLLAIVTYKLFGHKVIKYLR